MEKWTRSDLTCEYPKEIKENKQQQKWKNQTDNSRLQMLQLNKKQVKWWKIHPTQHQNKCPAWDLSHVHSLPGPLFQMEKFLDLQPIGPVMHQKQNLEI